MKTPIMVALALVLFGIMTVPVAAQIEGYSVDVSISDSTATYHTSINFTKYSSGLIMVIPGTPKDVVVSPSTCRIDKALLQTNIICDNPVNFFTVDYTSSERINRKGDWLVWADNFRLTEPASDFKVNVKLPAGIVLKEPIADAIEPEGATIGTDGRNILISWTAKDVSDQWSASIAYEQTGFSSATNILIAVLAIVAIAGGIAYKFYFSNSSKENMKIILPVLKKDEKSVLEGLIKHGSGVNQKMIVKESGYSKAKVSKVLKSLNERGLVKLERTGRSNRIFWGKEVKKDSQKSSRND